MKSAKRLWRISVTTTRDAEDAVAELLGKTLGQNPTAYWDAGKQQSVVSVFGPRTGIAAHKTRLAIAAGLRHISRCGLDIGPGRVIISRVPREDWTESWKRHFSPIEIGSTLLIKPSWVRRRPRKNQEVVILDPGLSFGTGNHATTAFCLCEIARSRPVRGAATVGSFLDIGTGSGILAIAAAKLGYQPVQAFDFDPDSVRIAQANARTNRVGGKIETTRDDVAKLPLHPTRKHDLICANLMANLLVAERRRIVAQLRPGGTLVLAGILLTEFAEVQQAFENLSLRLVRSRKEKEWRSGAFRFVAR